MSVQLRCESPALELGIDLLVVVAVRQQARRRAKVITVSAEKWPVAIVMGTGQRMRAWDPSGEEVDLDGLRRRCPEFAMRMAQRGIGTSEGTIG